MSRDSTKLTEDTVKMVEMLIDKLSLFNYGHEKIAVDLADIYESADKYLEILNKAIVKNEDVHQWQDTLILIEAELDHIKWHHKSLKNQLKKMFKEDSI